MAQKSLKKVVVYKDLPWYYAELLDWHVENGIVKAFPKSTLSDTAFKEVSRTFKRWGGAYVSRRGVAYFELVPSKPNSLSTEVAVKIQKAYEELQK